MVRVSPKSTREGVEGMVETPPGDAIAVRVRAVAEKGEANRAVERVIAEWIGVGQAQRGGVGWRKIADQDRRDRRRARQAGGADRDADRRTEVRSASFAQMTSAIIIDGKAIAAALRQEVAAGVAALKRERGVTPGLAVVLVGEDPASQVYVRTKAKATRDAGMLSFEHKLPADTPEAALLALIGELGRRAGRARHPGAAAPAAHIDTKKVIEAIDPAKDVDGFHPVNVGRLASGAKALAPCTPTGCLILAKSVEPKLEGLEAVVIGRSNIVGKPVAQLLLNENCTVTIAHSRTRDLPAVVRRADLVVAAAGRPEMVQGQLDQARRHRHRCRHSARGGVGRQEPAGRRRGLCGSGPGGARHHPGAGRRRADDGCLPAQEHARGGERRSLLSPERRPCTSNVRVRTNMWLICFTSDIGVTDPTTPPACWPGSALIALDNHELPGAGFLADPGGHLVLGRIVTGLATAKLSNSITTCRRPPSPAARHHAVAAPHQEARRCIFGTPRRWRRRSPCNAPGSVTLTCAIQ